MKQILSVKQACITAVCIALCCVLPIAFHAVGLGSTFSPMHIPVLLCGMVCGWGCGVVCGIAGPLLSSVVTGMPGATGMIFMVPELIVYGLATGLLMKFVRTGKLFGDLYLSLAGAMLLGRVAGGIVSAVFYLGKGQPFGIAMWASSYLLGTLPGIVCHLILIPALVLALMKAKLIPARYPASQVSSHA